LGGAITACTEIPFGSRVLIDVHDLFVPTAGLSRQLEFYSPAIVR